MREDKQRLLLQIRPGDRTFYVGAAKIVIDQSLEKPRAVVEAGRTVPVLREAVLRNRNMARPSGVMVYAACDPMCGCVVDCVLADADAGEKVAAWIRGGLVVERLPLEFAQPADRCQKHGVAAA